MKKSLLLLFALAVSFSAASEVRLPAIFGNNMVLQRECVTDIFGSSSPGAKITLVCSWDNSKYRTKADADGKWLAHIETPEAGGPYKITIDDGQRFILDNVMIGEVWICSGQSNMEMTIHGGRGEHTEHALETLLEAGHYPDIRLFTLDNVSVARPLDDCTGEWLTPDFGSVADFSAIAYHFGRSLAEILDIPIGLIVTSWGASSIEAWTPHGGLERLERELGWQMRPRPGDWKQKVPSALYNGMIHPLVKTRARGFIWYQGEGNRPEHAIYDRMMEAMVTEWREAWGDEDMPFYFVELAPHRCEDADAIDRALLVEAQHRAIKLIAHSGVVGTSDLGDSLSVHPPRKREIGQRLAMMALARDYGAGNVEETAGASFSRVEFSKDGTASVVFEGAPSGFIYDDSLSGFEIAGADMAFHQAQAATVYGRPEVKVWSKEVPFPVAVRYAFRNWTYGNLFNTMGVPAVPFRSDGGGYKGTILTLGDSNAATDNGWSRALELAIPEARIINRSTSGKCVGVSNMGNNELNSLLTIRPTLASITENVEEIVVALGTNDAKSVHASGREKYGDDMRRLIALIRESELWTRSRPEIILVACPPLDETRSEPGKYVGADSLLSEYNSELALIASETEGVRFVDPYDEVTDHRLDGQDLTKDGTHLTWSASRMVARKIAGVIYENNK